MNGQELLNLAKKCGAKLISSRASKYDEKTNHTLVVKQYGKLSRELKKLNFSLTKEKNILFFKKENASVEIDVRKGQSFIFCSAPKKHKEITNPWI